MSPGSAFYSLAAITGKARSPSVECRVTGTTKAAVDAGPAVNQLTTLVTAKCLCVSNRQQRQHVSYLESLNQQSLVRSEHWIRETCENWRISAFTSLDICRSSCFCFHLQCVRVSQFQFYLLFPSKKINLFFFGTCAGIEVPLDDSDLLNGQKIIGGVLRSQKELQKKFFSSNKLPLYDYG